MANYPNIKFPNDAAHMLFDMGYTYAVLARTRTVLESALDWSMPEHIKAEMQLLLEEIAALQKGRLQTINALYANADSALELLEKIVAPQEK
jgi:hypothetical protein